MSRVLVLRKSATSSACRSGGTGMPFTIDPTAFFSASGELPSTLDRRMALVENADSFGKDELMPSSTIGPLKSFFSAVSNATFWRPC
jgi:hypothetical protein